MMSIWFDSLQYRNNNQYGEMGPTVAEVGVIVDSLQSEVEDEDGFPQYVDLPASVEDGYYYVAMISKKNPNKKGFDTDKDRRYVVSKSSVFDYVFGYAEEDDLPEFLEDYKSIADAAESDFLDFFLFENNLVHEGNYDRALINNSRRQRMNGYQDGKTTIRIDRFDDFYICTKLFVDEETEIQHEIVFNKNSGGGMISDYDAVGGEGRSLIIPEQHFKLIKDGECLKEIAIIENLYDADYKYFPAFAKTEKTTKQNLLTYFEKNADELEARFSKNEIADLKRGILGMAIGMIEYRD